MTGSHQERTSLEKGSEHGSSVRVGDNGFDPACTFVTSPFLSSKALAAIRTLLASYTLVTALVSLIWDGVNRDRARGHYSYFTNLSWIGLTAYFCASSFHTVVYVKNGSTTYPLQKWPRFLQYLHGLLFSTIVTFPILVMIVYWALLADSESFATPYTAWANIGRHLLNAVFALLEIALGNTAPLPWLHLPVCVVLLGCYLGVGYVTFEAQGWYPYSFLDPKEQGAALAGYIIGIAVGECVIFAAVWGLIKLRVRLASKGRS
ncbi:hypothetical protein AX16_003033 [Volvariella volvacea WC 439]|nr:hypothetical protein AX16_003033 [Volvariella volvacea WC 439]